MISGEEQNKLKPPGGLTVPGVFSVQERVEVLQ
jgi:hypothetical protein